MTRIAEYINVLAAILALCAAGYLAIGIFRAETLDSAVLHGAGVYAMLNQASKWAHSISESA